MADFLQAVWEITRAANTMHHVTAYLCATQAVVAFMDRIEAIPLIKIYLHSTYRIVRPINNPQAQFK